jgi:DNA-binding HxlR family transcriptional regulator
MTKIPQPGSPVRGSSSGVPIMAAFDLLGRRWAMRILWEIAKGPCSFRELQERCGQMSPTSLNLRLKEMRASKIVTQEANLGYRLTELGEELNQALDPLRIWSEKWAAFSANDR